MGFQVWSPWSSFELRHDSLRLSHLQRYVNQVEKKIMRDDVLNAHDVHEGSQVFHVVYFQAVFSVLSLAPTFALYSFAKHLTCNDHTAPSSTSLYIFVLRWSRFILE